MGYIIIFVTARNEKEAKKIGFSLISEKLAACVNIIPCISSIFRWNKKIERTKEALLMAKTTQKLQPIVFKRIRQIHKYEIPEMIGFPIKYIDKKYLNWMKENISEDIT